MCCRATSTPGASASERLPAPPPDPCGGVPRPRDTANASSWGRAPYSPGRHCTGAPSGPPLPGLCRPAPPPGKRRFAPWAAPRVPPWLRSAQRAGGSGKRRRVRYGGSVRGAVALVRGAPALSTHGVARRMEASYGHAGCSRRGRVHALTALEKWLAGLSAAQPTALLEERGLPGAAGYADHDVPAAGGASARRRVGGASHQARPARPTALGSRDAPRPGPRPLGTKGRSAPPARRRPDLRRARHLARTRRHHRHEHHPLRQSRGGQSLGPHAPDSPTAAPG